MAAGLDRTILWQIIKLDKPGIARDPCGEIFVETDSMATKEPKDEECPLASVLDDIKKLLDSTRCTIQHTLQQGNMFKQTRGRSGRTRSENQRGNLRPQGPAGIFLFIFYLLASSHYIWVPSRIWCFQQCPQFFCTNK